MKLRVLAIKGPPKGRRPVPTLTYHAQVWAADPRKAPIWECDHDHDNPLAAHECGTQWLAAELIRATDPEN